MNWLATIGFVMAVAPMPWAAIWMIMRCDGIEPRRSYFRTLWTLLAVMGVGAAMWAVGTANGGVLL